MHLLARDLHSLDESEAAVDLGQSPAKIVFLSFSDAELGLLATLHEQGAARNPSLRCASLAQLKHPYSVDLYIEKVARQARLVVVRLLGGKDYWPYGVDELARAARRHGFALAIVPGDAHRDARLERASTLEGADLARIWSFFLDGGPDNLRSFLGLAATLIGEASAWRDSEPAAAAGRCVEACRQGADDEARAMLVFYRSAWLCGDIAPMVALADALHERRFSVEAIFVASLKDSACEDFVTRAVENFHPDVVLNATCFSARSPDGGGALDRADAPVLQVALATSTREAWDASKRGATGADLAMNVVLPEVDGRIFTRAISFKAEARRRSPCEFTEIRHAPEPSRVDFVAELAKNWARLRRKSNSEKQLALILSDYPRRGRGGYAIGLDTPNSVIAITAALRRAGYDIGETPVLRQPAASTLCQQRLPPVMAGLVPAIHAGTLRDDAGGTRTSRNFRVAALQHGVDARDKRGHDGSTTEAVDIICPNSLMRLLEEGEHYAELPIADYCRLFDSLPAEFTAKLRAAWGERGQAIARSEFSLATMIARYDQLYESLRS
ncbi:MAG: cobaltochelatase subunit CobN [Methylocystis sp.]|nr:cobaltochelatase subunit CobN [Methylocystis sp.]